MRKLLRSKKALSPVVAAIILIAVTVAVSIAVAAWMGSMTFTFMETEEMKITSIDFITTAGPVNDQIDVNVLNTGTTDITITATVSVSGLGATGTATTTQAIVGKGTTGKFSVDLGTGTWTAGSTYTVELLSSKGNKFAYTDTA